MLAQGTAQQSPVSRSRHGLPDVSANSQIRRGKVERRALSLIGRGGAEELGELVELRGCDVGDGPVCDPLLEPAIHVVSIYRARRPDGVPIPSGIGSIRKPTAGTGLKTATKPIG